MRDAAASGAAAELDHDVLRRAVISGIGQSDVGRRLFRSSLSLTLDAALAAVEDAGLTRDHIDGLAAYPGGGGAAPGFAGPSLLEVHDSLRLELSWYTSGVDVPAQLSPVMQAAMAVGSGMARHVLVYRTVTEGSARSRARAATEGAGSPPGGSSPGPAPRVEGPMQWLAAYGITGAPQWYAFYVRRYMHDFGLTREQLAQVPLSARTKAALNPKAVYREPVSLDDYLTSRMIADPLCLYDCDVPCDGATAFVVSRAGRIDAPSGHLVEIQSAGAGAGPRMYRDQFADVWWAGPAADQLWSRTELEQSDVDTAQLYDGFSFLALAWLESLGFCGRGEAGDFVDGGRRIALDGELPLNTGGGQLAAGRLHGLGHLHEACLQLRAQAGARQVPDAEVAIVATGGQPNMGCLLLTRSR